MFLQLSVILFTGGACSQGVPAPGGWGGLVLGGGGGALVWGVPAPGGRVPGTVGVPSEDPPRTATAAGGTHPTGMHS